MKSPNGWWSSRHRCGSRRKRPTDGTGKLARVKGAKSKSAYSPDRARVLAGLRRLEGHVRRLQMLAVNDFCCIDVLAQLWVVTAALEGGPLTAVEDHICSVDTRERVKELSATIERLVRS
jgi:DNA-binding FrmR family transcriptional regulator